MFVFVQELRVGAFVTFIKQRIYQHGRRYRMFARRDERNRIFAHYCGLTAEVRVPERRSLTRVVLWGERQRSPRETWTSAPRATRCNQVSAFPQVALHDAANLLAPMMRCGVQCTREGGERWAKSGSPRQCWGLDDIGPEESLVRGKRALYPS